MQKKNLVKVGYGQIKKAIKNLHNSIIKYPDIKYSDSLPASLEISDNLTDIKDEKLIVEAKKFISSLESRVKYDVDIYLKELLYNLNNIKISQDIFNYDEILRES